MHDFQRNEDVTFVQADAFGCHLLNLAVVKGGHDVEIAILVMPRKHASRFAPNPCFQPCIQQPPEAASTIRPTG